MPSKLHLQCIQHTGGITNDVTCTTVVTATQ